MKNERRMKEDKLSTDAENFPEIYIYNRGTGQQRSFIPTSNDVDLDQLADSLRQAVEEFGFFFIRNHGVSDNLIKRVFSENERWHNQPMEAKVAISIDDNQRGYIRPKATLIKHSTYNENTNLDTNETTVFATDYSIDNPNRQKGKRFYGENQWPENLPGFISEIPLIFRTI